ncbi:MAG: hypothetical protein GY757_53300, partial [bacterium]|nr:hypothetical protein [bacterium]
YKNFIETHRDVYGENNYRQGLFLLGTVISKIVYQQKYKKNDKKMKASSTFMKKINFDGIPARRVMALLAEVKDYSNIYDVYEEKGLWGNIMDRLQGIENSGMKGDEIVFYILTGVSFADYLGAKFAMDKKQETN